ncbi:MAG: exodeoxyribonuclease VII large subunit [Saprospiraceae bacterium]
MKSYTLFELNQFIRRVLALNLADALWIECEIAQCNQSRGHYWLELVEKGGEDQLEVVAQASAVIWSRQAGRLGKKLGPLFKDLLQEGRAVKLQVQIDFSERFGLKLLIQDIDPAYTLGQLALQKKAILDQLEAKQLLGKNRTVDLPTVIQKIAVISSDNAAGYQDFVQQLQQNAYGYAYQLEFHASAMQGAAVEREMLAALKRIRLKNQKYDAVVIIRGGGARLDLSAFDNYNLGLAIAEFPLPVFIGIGHDVDETVLDLVAHQSLKTPTAVADFIVHHNEQFEYRLQHFALQIQQHTFLQLKSQHLLVEKLFQQIENETYRQFNQASAHLNLYEKQIQLLAKLPIQSAHQELNNLNAQLQLLNPREILKRGYALIEKKDQRSIQKAAELEEGEEIKIIFQDGSLNAKINSNQDE